MNQLGRTGSFPVEPFKAPTAVDLLGDALPVAARRPALLAPLMLLDGLIALVVAANVTILSRSLSGGPVDLPVSPGMLTGLFLPALLPFGGLEPVWQGSLPAVMAGNGLSGLWTVSVVLIGAVLGVVFLRRLAVETSSSGHRRSWNVGYAGVAKRCMALSLLLLVVPAFAGAPFLMAGLVMNRVEASALPLIAVTVVLAGGAFFFLRLSFDALVVDDVPALEAIARSWSVVSQQPLAALRLLALSACIAAGTRVLWISVIETPVGLIAGITGNAMIATALALARMNFYRIVRGAIPIRASSHIVPGT